VRRERYDGSLSRRESTHGPIPSPSVVHRRDFRRTRREAAGAGDLQRNLHGKIDRWQFLEFRPPIYARSTLGAREAGSDLPFGTPTHVVLNSFTPETERTTHYFWSTVRSWGLDDAKVSKIYKDMTDLAFAEDARMVELQQQLIDSDPSGTPLVSLAFDRAALAARRIIKRKLEEESQAAAQVRPAKRVAIRGADVTA
jgi:phenylpropionate dioxygenase-like ring-hydroxylating dioxygenase large terminal subunit